MASAEVRSKSGMIEKLKSLGNIVRALKDLIKNDEDEDIKPELVNKFESIHEEVVAKVDSNTKRSSNSSGRSTMEQIKINEIYNSKQNKRTLKDNEDRNEKYPNEIDH